MRKSGLIIVLVAAMVLTSCSLAAPIPAATETIPAVTAAWDTATPLPTANLPTSTPTVISEPTTVITKSDPAACQAVSPVPTPDPTAEAILPAASSSDWIEGKDTALVTLIEYGDFQDASSAALFTVLQQLMDNYPDDVRLVFRHFPLDEKYDKDSLAAQAAEAAGKQGKFFQFSKILFVNQKDWTSLSSSDFTDWAYNRAAELGLDGNQFKLDMLADETTTIVKNARTQAVQLIQAGTLTSDPYLFMNGNAVNPPYSLDSMTNLVKYFQLSKNSYTSCPEMTIDLSKEYTATIHTEKGDIKIKLYADKAPWAVNSFVFLARENWYNNSGFFRVIPGFMAQAGDPSNSGLGNPGYTFGNEFDPSLRFDKPGMVGMASDGKGNNGSQFFITYAAVPSLDGKYTVFGEVTEGLDVLTTLRPRDPSSDAILLTPDPILSISIEEK